MEKTNDGFVIADEDLKLRGPGEYFGLKQSGFLKYKIANMVTDGKIIKDARKLAFDIIKNDPNLMEPNNLELRNNFKKNYADQLDQINLS